MATKPPPGRESKPNADQTRRKNSSEREVAETADDSVALLSRSTASTHRTDGQPEVEPRSHPVFDKLMQDVESQRGRLVMHEERFEFWAKRLSSRYPRRDNGVLYRQIFAAACLLAPIRCPAALQLFALACLGLHPVLAWRAASANQAFRTQAAQELRVRTESVGASGMAQALKPKPSGVSIAKMPRRS